MTVIRQRKKHFTRFTFTVKFLVTHQQQPEFLAKTQNLDLIKIRTRGNQDSRKSSTSVSQLGHGKLVTTGFSPARLDLGTATIKHKKTSKSNFVFSEQLNS